MGLSLNLVEQKHAVAIERWRRHSNWCERMDILHALSPADRRIALQILVGEACRRHVEHCKEVMGVSAQELAVVRLQWRDVMERVRFEMSCGEHNHANVIKCLSCMCVFQKNVSLDFGDNCDQRSARLDRQRELLCSLRLRGALFL